MAAALTLDPSEQRLSLLSDRRQIMPSGPLTATIISCGELGASRPDEVFITPSGSPYSQDGSTGYRGDMYFTGEGSMDPSHHHMHPPVTSSGHYSTMSPGSPCDDYYRSSPYSPSYDTSSPHSIACSASPHGSPSIPGSDANHFSSYISETSMSNLPHPPPPPTSTLPISSCTSHPYSDNSGGLIYTNVPVSGPVSGLEYYHPCPSGMQGWEEGSHMHNFEGSYVGQGEAAAVMQQAGHHHPQVMEGGEVPINIIEQPNHLQSEMMANINVYPDGSPIPHGEIINGTYCPHDMNVLAMHPELQHPGVLLPPPLCATQKPKPPRKPKKPKPAIQVNDEHIKDIPTSAQLWEFTLRVLKKPAYHYMVNWENRKEGLFRFHDANAFAALWGKHRNRPHMTYDKVARALRYYYKRDILNQVGGRLTYRFSKRLNKLYASDE